MGNGGFISALESRLLLALVSLERAAAGGFHAGLEGRQPAAPGTTSQGDRKEREDGTNGPAR